MSSKLIKLTKIYILKTELDEIFSYLNIYISELILNNLKKSLSY